MARAPTRRRLAADSGSSRCASGRRCWVGRLNFSSQLTEEHSSVCGYLLKARMDMATKITVLLVDDHTLVRRGFRRLLEDDPAIAVVGEASDGDEAVTLAASLKPQVVVMDCAMPGT